MNQTNLNAFTKISDESAKIKIFQDLIGLPSLIQLKEAGEPSSICLLRASSLLRLQLKCEPVPGAPRPSRPGDALITFQVGDEKYYSTVEVVLQDEEVFLLLESSLFHLQRREDFRLKIPESAKLTLLINGAPSTLLDLSSGGLKAEVETQYRLGEKIQYRLYQENKFSLQGEGSVRFTKILQQKPQLQQIGLQFEGHTEAEKNKVFAVVMDLYKEIFKKL